MFEKHRYPPTEISVTYLCVHNMNFQSRETSSWNWESKCWSHLGRWPLNLYLSSVPAGDCHRPDLLAGDLSSSPAGREGFLKGALQPWFLASDLCSSPSREAFLKGALQPEVHANDLHSSPSREGYLIKEHFSHGFLQVTCIQVLGERHFLKEHFSQRSLQVTCIQVLVDRHFLKGHSSQRSLQVTCV